MSVAWERGRRPLVALRRGHATYNGRASGPRSQVGLAGAARSVGSIGFRRCDGDHDPENTNVDPTKRFHGARRLGEFALEPTPKASSSTSSMMGLEARTFRCPASRFFSVPPCLRVRFVCPNKASWSARRCASAARAEPRTSGLAVSIVHRHGMKTTEEAQSMSDVGQQPASAGGAVGAARRLRRRTKWGGAMMESCIIEWSGVGAVRTITLPAGHRSRSAEAS